MTIIILCSSSERVNKMVLESKIGLLHFMHRNIIYYLMAQLFIFYIYGSPFPILPCYPKTGKVCTLSKVEFGFINQVITFSLYGHFITYRLILNKEYGRIQKH